MYNKYKTMSESEKRSAFPDVELEFELKDKDGNLIKFHRQKARSWTKNFIFLLRYGLASSDINLVKQDGTLTTIQGYVNWPTIISVSAGNGDDSFGIIIGSGTTPYTINDYKLDNKISGSALFHGPVSVEDLTDTGTTLYFKIARTFINSSQNPVTVTEVGLVINANGSKALIARDLLTTSATVPVGGSLTIRYVISYQYA